MFLNSFNYSATEISKGEYKMRKLFIIWLTFCISPSFSQEVKVNGGFVQDSLLIGQNIQYWMSATYPIEYEIFLPDSTYSFSPFEFSSKEYFETTSDSTLATDSAIYSLQSFEIDLVQYLSLPTILVIDSDSSSVQSPTDSIYLKELVEVATDTTALIVNTEFQKVNQAFNSPLFLAILATLLIILIVIVLVFGRRIRSYFRLKRMKKAHELFLSKFGQVIDQLNKEGNPETSEIGINLWKQYLEKLEKLPMTKLTSKEITSYNFAKELSDSFLAIDQCVYGKVKSEKIYLDFQLLEDFAQNRFELHCEILKESKK